MDSIYLHGSEDVRSAASTISQAALSLSSSASSMCRAADTIRDAVFNFDSAMERQRLFMDEWLRRFEQCVNSSSTTLT